MANPIARNRSLAVGLRMSTSLFRQSLAYFAPALPHLLRRRRAGRTDLLNGDRCDETAERRRFFIGRPGRDGAGDAGTGAVAGADDVDGAADGIGGDVLM